MCHPPRHGAGQKRHHFACERRHTGRRIARGIERVGEAIEIMDGARHARYVDQGRALRHPVGGNDKYGLGARQCLAEFRPGAMVFIILDGVHRAAMPEKNQRHPVGGRKPVPKRLQGLCGTHCGTLERAGVVFDSTHTGLKPRLPSPMIAILIFAPFGGPDRAGSLDPKRH